MYSEMSAHSVINESVEEIGVVIDEEFMEPISEEDDVKEVGCRDLDGFSHKCKANSTPPHGANEIPCGGGIIW